MAPINTNILQTRQSTTDTTVCHCPDGVSSGALGGIIVGTIGCTLLLLWIVRCAWLPGTYGERHPALGYSTIGGPRRRRSTEYVDVIEERVRPRSRGDSLRRPAKAYLS